MAESRGQQIGPYTLIDILGRGGMATVYYAQRTADGQPVAIKILLAELAGDHDFHRRFEREARLVMRMEHPHILPILDFGEVNQYVYLVMPLMTGGTLAHLLHDGPLALNHTAHLLSQIASALNYAHAQGVIHRDLKPENVLLDETGRAYLTDFGIAKMLAGGTTMTASGVLMGTPAYMAPEQWRSEPVDARTDVYALGMLLYEMLVGLQPFEADTPYGLMLEHLDKLPASPIRYHPHLPGPVESVIYRAIAKAPQDRYPSSTALADAFATAITPIANTDYRPPRPPQRFPSYEYSPYSDTEDSTFTLPVLPPDQIPEWAQRIAAHTPAPPRHDAPTPPTSMRRVPTPVHGQPRVSAADRTTPPSMALPVPPRTERGLGGKLTMIVLSVIGVSAFAAVIGLAILLLRDQGDQDSGVQTTLAATQAADSALVALTDTASFTPTDTATADTGVIVILGTATPTATATTIPTNTLAATSTATATVTATATATFAPTETFTPAPTLLPVLSVTPTLPPAPSATPRPTDTPTLTPTIMPTFTTTAPATATTAPATAPATVTITAAATATATMTTTVTTTVTATDMPTLCFISARTTAAVNIHNGPGTGFAVVDRLLPGEYRPAALRTTTGFVYIYTGWVDDTVIDFTSGSACAELPEIAARASDAATVCTISAALDYSDLRTAPDPDADRAYLAQRGTPLNVFRVVTGVDGRTWYYAATDDAAWHFGWMPASHAQTLTDCPPAEIGAPGALSVPTPTMSAVTSTTATTTTPTCFVEPSTTGALNVRYGPGAGFGVVEQLQPGQQYPALLRTATGYIYVGSGWVDANYVRLTPAASCAALPTLSEDDMSSGAICTIVAASTPSDLRTGPSLSADRMYLITNGTTLSAYRVVTGDDGQVWYYAGTNDGSGWLGWMPAAQVSLLSPCPAPEPDTP